MGCRFLSLRVRNNKSNLKQGSHAHWFQRKRVTTIDKSEYSLGCHRLPYKLHCHSMRAFANEWNHNLTCHMGIDCALFFWFCIILLSLLCRCDPHATEKKVLNFIVSFLRVFFFSSSYGRTSSSRVCCACVFGELVACGIDLLPTKTSNTTKMNNRDHMRMQSKM